MRFLDGNPCLLASSEGVHILEINQTNSNIIPVSTTSMPICEPSHSVSHGPETKSLYFNENIQENNQELTRDQDNTHKQNHDYVPKIVIAVPDSLVTRDSSISVLSSTPEPPDQQLTSLHS